MDEAINRDPAQISIHEAPFNGRAFNRLFIDFKCQTIADVGRLTPAQLTHTPGVNGIGKGTVKHIQEVLDIYGLKLAPFLTNYQKEILEIIKQKFKPGFKFSAIDLFPSVKRGRHELDRLETAGVLQADYSGDDKLYFYE